MMIGKSGANITAAYANPAHFNLILKIADYIKVLAKTSFRVITRLTGWQFTKAI